MQIAVMGESWRLLKVNNVNAVWKMTTIIRFLTLITVLLLLLLVLTVLLPLLLLLLPQIIIGT